MSETISEERLNDYVDGLLSEQEAADVERHLALSAEARDTVDFLRELRQRAVALPRSIAPQRDLWPGIRRSMAPAPLVSVAGDAEAVSSPNHPGRESSTPAQRHEQRGGWPSLGRAQWALFAAAAMVLVVTSSAITAWIVGVPAAGSASTPPDAGATAATEVALQPPIGAEYAIEIERLLSALDENRENLDPDAVTTIETNLRVIDRAIRTAREALGEDPQNAGLTRMLTSNYRHKLELLQRASRLIELS